MLSFTQTLKLCPRHGDFVVEVVRDAQREHGCCPTCEPDRYMKLLKEATDIKMLTDKEKGI